MAMSPEERKVYEAGLYGKPQAGPGEVSKLGSLGKGLKKAAPAMIGWMLLQKLLDVRGQRKDIGVQREAIEEQSALATPENLYYQASLPQAKQEEEMARTALMTQLSGGVIGPTQLARGERNLG